MRPLRFLITVASCIVAFLLLLYVGPWRTPAQEDLENKGRIRARFNWRTPSSFFPPSAIISLTDDNSTFFLARPAGFGPILSTSGLSGQLWVGSGFGQDRLGRGVGAEGELGCSDVPGWGDRKYEHRPSTSADTVATQKKAKGVVQDSTAGTKRRRDVEADKGDVVHEGGPVENDGTDDHLHHPLPPSDGLKSNGASSGISKTPTHADIQSLQEGAEITGKIVLLSRGGCGFLEKVKWAQRRGGVALIVGDDVRGGQLVNMYAHGDTSNVTIPSLFTSHTTAHLLSSLIPSEGALDGVTLEEAERLGLVLVDKAEVVSPEHAQDQGAGKAVFTTTSAAAEATAGSSTKAQDEALANELKTVSGDGEDDLNPLGWFQSLFGRGRSAHEDSRRPPSSGHIGWVLQDEFEEDESFPERRRRKQTPQSNSVVPAPTTLPQPPSGDGFVIGVQDWRDPDLVAEQKEQLLAVSSSSSSAQTTQSSRAPPKNNLKGGSITPGSGEYVKAVHGVLDTSKAQTNPETRPSVQQTYHEPVGWVGWVGALFHSNDHKAVADTASEQPEVHAPKTAARPEHVNRLLKVAAPASRPDVHEGLWITLTPTSMSSSPFFDTLLVLVVSPLVTLTVVYALLLLRSRIRRRRWRAPKSVVERLPVRTYQTMPTDGRTSSTTSSVSSPISVTTPLLPSVARPINNRSRPRSRTTPAELAVPGSSVRSDDVTSPSLGDIEEKRAAGLAEWRRRYVGRQRECVVCLEEYIDGVSRVMSLPCGHEFHAECITPWLTTRRRTCPICKGDVVRSLNRTTSSSPPQAVYHDESEDADDVQERAAVTRNDDPASALPVNDAAVEEEVFDEDLERGVAPDRTR